MCGYYDIIASEACDPAGFAVNPNVAIVLPLLCHDDPQVALDRALEGAQFFGYALGHYYVFGSQQPGRTDIWSAFKASRDSGFSSTANTLVGGDAEPAPAAGETDGVLRSGIGTPEQLRAVLRSYEAAGVDQVVFLTQAGRTAHEHICESLELFAREVMPEFAERDPAHTAAKAERLAGAVAAAMRRKAPPRELSSEYSYLAKGKL